MTELKLEEIFQGEAIPDFQSINGVPKLSDFKPPQDGRYLVRDSNGQYEIEVKNGEIIFEEAKKENYDRA